MKTVESAGGVILNEFNEVVVVLSNTNSWQFPKGTVENGETYLETAIREIEEETGLKVLTPIKKLPAYSRISTHEQDTLRYIHYFLFKTEKQPVKPSHEIIKCEWISVNEVMDRLTYPEDKKFFQEIKNELNNLALKK